MLSTWTRRLLSKREMLLGTLCLGSSPGGWTCSVSRTHVPTSSSSTLWFFHLSGSPFTSRRFPGASTWGTCCPTSSVTSTSQRSFRDSTLTWCEGDVYRTAAFTVYLIFLKKEKKINMKYGNFKSLTVDPKLNVHIDTSTLNMISVTNSYFIIFSLKSNGAFTRSRVWCICPRPFPFSPPSWQFWSRTAWLSWAGRPIGRGPADAPPVSAAASRRRPEEARGQPCPTRAGSSGSSPRPRPGRET